MGKGGIEGSERGVEAKKETRNEKEWEDELNLRQDNDR